MAELLAALALLTVVALIALIVSLTANVYDSRLPKPLKLVLTALSALTLLGTSIGLFFSLETTIWWASAFLVVQFIETWAVVVKLAYRRIKDHRRNDGPPDS